MAAVLAIVDVKWSSGPTGDQRYYPDLPGYQGVTLDSANAMEPFIQGVVGTRSLGLNLTPYELYTTSYLMVKWAYVDPDSSTPVLVDIQIADPKAGACSQEGYTFMYAGIVV